jgi:RNA polymerase sigma-70 factor (ECF subfamily)
VDELELTSQARCGDARALAMLLQRHYDFVKKYLIKITLSPALAEELTQETMLRCIEKIHTYRDQSKFSSWMMTIATRIYIDLLRRRKREQRWIATDRWEQQLKWQINQWGSSWPEVLQALGQLTPEQRTSVIMKHYYGYEIQEIAEIMDVPEGTVKSRIHHGMHKLRKELSEDEVEPTGR